MDTAITILLILFIAIELLYLVTCVITIHKIITYRKTTSDNRTLSISTIAFLMSCIAGSIVNNIHDMLGERFAVPIFILFLVVEILYLLIITQIALNNTRMKPALSLLLLCSLLFIPYLASKKWTAGSYDPLFAYESLIVTSISFTYFLQLGYEIKIKNVLKDPVTLIVLGLFFCYSLPFAYNTVMTVSNLLERNFYQNIRQSKYDHFLLAFVSRVGTLCYIIFNIFIYKAFKCKKQVPVGISL
jgi:hypothetical protein